MQEIFWKGRDSYRQLQNAFYEHVKSKGFELERGLPVEETGAKHEKIENLKKLTNYENTKKILKNIKLELPEVSDINDIQFSNKKRDLEIEFKEKERQLKSDCRDIINDYEKENNHLKRLVDTFKKTIKIFIKWICKKFYIAEDYALVRDFEKETRVSLDTEKQVQKENREKEIEWDYER